MRELFTRQLAKARRSDGAIDLAVLGDLVRATYDEAEADRRRTDRAISQMVEEVDRLHAQLRDAFDVVPEGLVLFDEEDRFVLWNKRYAELYPELGDHLAVGVCYADALRHVVETHGYEEAVGREEEWLRERLERHARPSNVEEQRLHDGRWLRIEECRTSDGGSVGIRVDITELKRREASFRLLYENNPVPMFVYDAETLRIVSVNDRAVAHYGYDRAAFLALTILSIRPKEDIEATLEAEPPRLVVAGGADHLHRRLRDFLIRSAKADLAPAVARHAARLAVEIRNPRIRIKDTRSRWGSCTASGATARPTGASSTSTSSPSP